MERVHAMAVLLCLTASCGGGNSGSTESGSSGQPATGETSSTSNAAGTKAAGGTKSTGNAAGGSKSVSGASGMGALAKGPNGQSGSSGATASVAGASASAAGSSGTTAAPSAAAGASGASSAGAGASAMMAVPEDGDPSKPMVSIPEIPCGVPKSPFPTVKITNRDVAIAYPCAHEGAPVTFFLFVHGTLNEQMKISFTMNAYSVHELVDSHNVLIATPKAVGTQWGNGDNGADLPHLHEVVNWVYTTFGDKFNIRSMWSHGGSWGARYLSTFACDEMLKDRLKGVYMVVGGGCPMCSDRLSCVVIQQELQEGNGMTIPAAQQEMLVDEANIAPYAMMHGCDGKMGPNMVGAVREWLFPNCDPGWLYGYYLGPGQHADKLDQTAVIKLTDEMKATEK